MINQSRKKPFVLLYFLAVIFLLLSSGCDKNEGSEQWINDHGTVEIPIDSVEMLGVSDRTLYAFANRKNGFSAKKFNAETGEENGETIFPDFFAERLYCCDIEGQTAYIAAETFTTVAPTLYKANVGTGEVALMYEFEPFSTISKIRKDGDTLYILGTTTDDANRNGSYELYLQNEQFVSYEHNGERFAELNLTNGEITDSGIRFPVAFDERGGTVFLYAFDEENGYYFLNYKTGERFDDSCLGTIGSMTLVNENGNFYLPDLIGDDADALRFYGIGEGRGVLQRETESAPAAFLTPVSENGYLYTVTFGDIVDGVNELFLSGFYVGDVNTKTSPIRIVNSDPIEPPYRNGYAISQTMLDNEDFALKTLSLDPSFDIAMFRTNSVYARAMRKSGGFYPLNDVDGAAEYIDRCFPAVKEAVTDEDGNIWAFPVRVEMSLFVYDEKNCAAENIGLDTDLNGFFNITDKLGSSEYYSYNQFQLRQSCFSQYLTKSDTFDTPLFRDMARTLKEHWDSDGVTANWELITDMGSDAPSAENTDNFLFMDAVQLYDQKGRSEGQLICAPRQCRRSETQSRI